MDIIRFNLDFVDISIFIVYEILCIKTRHHYVHTVSFNLLHLLYVNLKNFVFFDPVRNKES